MILTSCFHEHEYKPLVILRLAIKISDRLTAIEVDHIGRNKIERIGDNHLTDECGNLGSKSAQNVAQRSLILDGDQAFFRLGQPP